ncbi:phospholipase D family protein [Acinetobacter beijerinckii]|jgi:phosphatidylserine/phosphatidylglycerophosphate/cardiolipin synthase-like enzyme|uniref:phospholipase D family protein n=1 Tax=Acinetobacter beijerinckii TaxID=262668 RepID=UPI002406D730|nr:phospholipase D family protein [Acinetobacter beijerinckii]
MRIFQRIHQKLNWSGRRYMAVILSIFAIGYIASAIYHTVKPLPKGLDFTGQLRHANVKFLADQTYIDAKDQQQVDQHIFNEIFKLIDEAQTTIVLDMFLFNQEVGESKVKQFPLMQQLTDALIVKRTLNPAIQVVVITDPINSVYGGIVPKHYRQLRQAGVDVIETDLRPLRASNPLWSGFWYICCQNLGNNSEGGWLSNPFGKDKVTLRSYLELLNFKANHRKTLVVDTAEGWKSLVTSANPHDGSSHHSNVALVVDGPTAIDVLQTEQAVANMSHGSSPFVIMGGLTEDKSLPQVQVLTEKAIYDATLKMIQNAKLNEHLDMAMFYLSERNIIEALKQAKQRGVNVRIMLDPNKDAFGRQKNGIPNRQVASELNAAGIPIRWCNTRGEQCHSKMLLKYNAQQAELMLGSANFTARNLKNYNLETDMRVIGSVQAPVFQDATTYFNSSWTNANGRQMTVDYKQYADESKAKYWLYRFMEWSGLSTF